VLLSRQKIEEAEEEEEEEAEEEAGTASKWSLDFSTVGGGKCMVL
jgi:hypothetical protein